MEVEFFENDQKIGLRQPALPFQKTFRISLSRGLERSIKTCTSLKRFAIDGRLNFKRDLSILYFMTAAYHTASALKRVDYI